MRKLILGVALASSALATPALAKSKSWYVEGDGGAMLVEDADVAVAGTSNAPLMTARPATISAPSSVTISVASASKPKPAIAALAPTSCATTPRAPNTPVTRVRLPATAAP
jgi:hypothetical protein